MGQDAGDLPRLRLGHNECGRLSLLPPSWPEPGWRDDRVLLSTQMTQPVSRRRSGAAGFRPEGAGFDSPGHRPGSLEARDWIDPEGVGFDGPGTARDHGWRRGRWTPQDPRRPWDRMRPLQGRITDGDRLPTPGDARGYRISPLQGEIPPPRIASPSRRRPSGCPENGTAQDTSSASGCLRPAQLGCRFSDATHPIVRHFEGIPGDSASLRRHRAWQTPGPHLRQSATSSSAGKPRGRRNGRTMRSS
jgi:hypothetical protein